MQARSAPTTLGAMEVSPTELRKRIRAARGYAGMSIDDLAEAVELGRNTIIRIENGERDPKPMEVREIAARCGLPYTFFTVDFAELAQREQTGGSEWDELLTALAPNLGEHELGRLIYEALDASLEDFRQAALATISRRLKEAGVDLPSTKPRAASPAAERPAEGEERAGLPFPRGRQQDAQDPDEGDRRAS